MIRAEGLTFHRNGRCLLRSATFSVAAGQVVVITGPNGSGKSLLAQALVGLTPVAGKVMVGGRPVGRSKGRRLIGYLPQNAAHYDYLTVGENLHLFAAMAGVPWRGRAKVVHDLLELVGLKGMAAAPLSGLSPGQRQRLSLARALAGDPPVLVLDEPLTGLDAHGRQEALHLLKELAGMGKAVLVITGDPQGIPNDRMLFLEDGWLKGGVLA